MELAVIKEPGGEVVDDIDHELFHIGDVLQPVQVYVLVQGVHLVPVHLLTLPQQHHGQESLHEQRVQVDDAVDLLLQDLRHLVHVTLVVQEVLGLFEVGPHPVQHRLVFGQGQDLVLPLLEVLVCQTALRHRQDYFHAQREETGQPELGRRVFAREVDELVGSVNNDDDIGVVDDLLLDFLDRDVQPVGEVLPEFLLQDLYLLTHV